MDRSIFRLSQNWSGVIKFDSNNNFYFNFDEKLFFSRQNKLLLNGSLLFLVNLCVITKYFYLFFKLKNCFG